MKFQLLYILLIVNTGYSQNTIGDDDKKTLKLLLKERKERFEQYTTQLDDKSGFFGNQTKKDVKNINEVLKEIVRTDNKIILELDQLTDQKRFETKSFEFETKKSGEDIAKLARQNEKYIAAIDTLNKQVHYYKKVSKTGKSLRIYKWLSIVFFASTAILLYLFLKNRKKIK